MKILEVLRILNESEKERLLQNINNLDKEFPKEQKIEKDRFFRKVANSVEDELGKIIKDSGSQTVRNQFFNLQSIKSFGLKPRDIEGLRAILGECELEAYSKFLSKSHPQLTSGWLKGIYQQLSDYIPPEIKRGPKRKQEWSKERQIDLDISTIFNSLSSVKPGTAGPFELLLCVIFGGTKIEGKSSYKGDILIDGTAYEVKADGTGALDAGYRRIENEMQKAQGEELNELRTRFEQEKKDYEKEIAKCTKLAQKFAKVLAKQYKLSDKDVKDYFAILTEEDKKRAILYGFYECGYRNFIICNPRKSKYDFDVYIKIVTEDMLKKVIDGQGVTLSSIGIDITTPAGKYTESCRFGDYLIKTI